MLFYKLNIPNSSRLYDTVFTFVNLLQLTPVGIEFLLRSDYFAAYEHSAKLLYHINIISIRTEYIWDLCNIPRDADIAIVLCTISL